MESVTHRDRNELSIGGNSSSPKSRYRAWPAPRYREISSSLVLSKLGISRAATDAMTCVWEQA